MVHGAVPPVSKPPFTNSGFADVDVAVCGDRPQAASARASRVTAAALGDASMSGALQRRVAGRGPRPFTVRHPVFVGSRLHPPTCADMCTDMEARRRAGNL